jgi:hypothetical protein
MLRHRPLDYSFEVTAIHHEDEQGATLFTADVTIRDAKGNEVSRLKTERLHSYVEAAEDEAVEAARKEIRRLRNAAP